MEIINNRYKIEDIYKKEKNSMIYFASDLFNSNKKILIKIFDVSSKSKNFTDYLINEFIYISSIKHRTLQSIYDFDIIELINNKKTSKKNYFYTKEFIPYNDLESTKEKLSLNDITEVLIQLLELMDYLNFRGENYTYLNPENIFINKSDDNLTIKLNDLVSIKEYENDNIYDEFNINYISNVQKNTFDKSRKNILNSIGRIGEYLLNTYTSNKRIKHDKEYEKYNHILNVINNMLNIENLIDKKDFNELIFDLNKEIHEEYITKLRNQRENINYNVKIIGRDNEIKLINNLTNDIENGNTDIKVLSITGEAGSGKSRFLDEIYYRLRMEGKIIFKTKIDRNSDIELKPIIDIIRGMIKFCDESLIEKYGCELVKIIPEIGYTKEIKPSASLCDDREKLRLYDRISRFLVDCIENQPIFIIFDHFYNADVETLNFINYFINNFNEVPVLFLVSYNTEKSINDKISELVDIWTSSKKLLNINMSKFNLDETALIIKNMLGMDKKPIEFSTRILRDTKGNPRHIEEVIKNLYSNGNLNINCNGIWSTTEDINDLYIPSNVDEAIEIQLEFIDDDLCSILKVISIFNTSVSMQIISKMMSTDECIIDNILEKLLRNKILDKMVEDWGFTYDFNNIKFKKYILHKLEREDKVNLYHKATDVLEELYLNGNRIYAEELIYHLIMSNQVDKAIDYCIRSAKNMQYLSIHSQAISFWQKALTLLENKLSIKRVETLFNLGELFDLQGKYNEALKYLNESLQIAKELDSLTYIIICKNSIANIYHRKNQLIEAENFAREARLLSEQIQYTDGILQSSIIVNRINIANGNNEKVLNDCIKYLYIAEKEHKEGFIGEFLNQIGVIQMILGQYEAAERYLNRSLNNFEKCNDFSGITRVMNNLGLIFSELYCDFDKSIEYMEKGLDISNKHNNFKSQITFLNNIGSSYFDNKHEFHKAKEYFERILEIGKDVDIDNIFSLVSMNLGFINLRIGKYDECFKDYRKLIENKNRNMIQWQELAGYYEFLMKFYINFGLYDDALKTYEEIKKEYSSNDYKFNLCIESTKVIADFHKYGSLDKEKINHIRNEYSNSKFYVERRYQLLQFAYISVEVDKEFAENIILEYENILDSHSTAYLEIVFSFLKLWLNKLPLEEELLIYKNVKKLKIPELQIMINIVLGDREYEKSNFYDAINYYAIAIDILRRLINDIPDENIKNRMKNSNLSNKIKSKLDSIQKNFTLKDEIAISIESENNSDKLYYDFTVLDKYFHEGNYFNENYLNNKFSEIDDIKNIEDLISQFSTNQIQNLELLLKFAMKETFAERGYISFLADEEDNKILVNSQSDDWYLQTNNVIKATEKMREGILVNSPIVKGFNPYSSFIKEDIKSIICIPIYKNTNNILNENDRRKFSVINKNEVIGYIYLDTDKLFNKFNEKSFNLIKTLANLVFINIDNYFLKIISSIDKLTGAYTRKYMDSSFDEILVKSKSMSEEFSIIMIDIDKFKNVNDTFGHQKGDEVLSKLSESIIQTVRKSDIVARYGGEEFLVILPNTNEQQAKDITEKIRIDVFNKKLMGDDYPITISLGISTYPHHAKVKDDLIEKADQALYHAKNNGRNRAILWDENIAKHSNRSDKLAGIITGNTVEDQRKVLAMVEIIDLIKQDLTNEDKIYLVLGRIIEMIEAEFGSLILVDENKVKDFYSRVRFNEDWSLGHKLNNSIIDKVINDRLGECMIDWENVRDIDILTGNPNWHSIIVTPLIKEGDLKGLLYISVPIKEKEFDYRAYNFVSTIGDIISAII